jgi:hypothetical protein
MNGATLHHVVATTSPRAQDQHVIEKERGYTNGIKSSTRVSKIWIILDCTTESEVDEMSPPDLAIPSVLLTNVAVVPSRGIVLFQTSSLMHHAWESL